jgi:NAD(P)-dependent dehydrogenase (short-subunit alcohol dehydrogenase family)
VAQVTAEVTARPGRVAEVEGRALDVTDPAAITALAAELGRVDLVISNATGRMSPDADPADEVDGQFDTSNLATTRMLRAFLPLLRPGGTFLVVSSALGTLGQLPSEVRPVFASTRTLDDVDAAIEHLRAEVKAGTAVSQGWPRWLNIPSKVAQVAAVRAVAADRRDADLASGTLIASVCPGLIDTGASRPWFADMSSAQTPEEAAGPVLDLALHRPVDPSTYGELIQFGKVLPWESAAETGHRATT